MQKRLAQLSQAFEHLKFEQCLRQSDQIIKKIEKSGDQKSKKKNSLDEQSSQNLYMVRIGSLAALGHLHEAHQLLRSKFPDGVTSEQGSFLFLQICLMALDRKLPHYLKLISEYKEKEKKNIDVNRFMLLTNNFSQLSRIFLKKYATEKKLPDSFAQIYLQYLQQLHNTSSIEYTQDRIFRTNPKLDLRFVSIFLDKFIATFKDTSATIKDSDAKTYLRIKEGIKQFRLRIAVNTNKPATVREIVQQAGEEIGIGGRAGEGLGNLCVYLRSLRAMQEEKQENEVVWKREFLRIFQNNLNLDNYQPVYDYSIQFLSDLISSTQIPEAFPEKPQILLTQQLYTFYNKPVPQISKMLNSLFSEYKLLKSNESENKKKDYYKISLKNCILLLLYTLRKIFEKNGNICIIHLMEEYLLIYKEEYGRKLTFPDQVRDYFGIAKFGFGEQFLSMWKAEPQTIQNQEDRLIWRINYERMFAVDPITRTLQQNIQEWTRIYQLYKDNLVTVEKSRKLEKGQRYLSDQFLSIQADSIRRYLMNMATPPPIFRSICQYILCQLQPSISVSPSNHDLKLRTLYFLDLLNYSEQCTRILQSLDIKASQYQTLGYLYYKSLVPTLTPQTISSSSQQLLKKHIRSYQQVWKQCIEYAYKSIVGITFSQCEEYLCYFDNIKRSYSFCILLYMLYLRNRGKPGAVYYLREILDRLTDAADGRGLAFNADGRVYKNLVEVFGETCDYVDFYGIYNSQDILKLECQIKLCLWQTIKPHPNPNPATLTNTLAQLQTISSHPQSLLNFCKYEKKAGEINYTYKGDRYNEKVITNQLKIMLQVYEVLVAVCRLVGGLQNFEGLAEAVKEVRGTVGELVQRINGLGFGEQIRLIPQIRTHIVEAITVVNTHLQNLPTPKKGKPAGTAQRKQALIETMALLTESTTTSKLKVSPPVDELDTLFSQMKELKAYRQVCLHRDSVLVRVVQMSVAEFKKMYRLK